jgi:hypothetical protein
MKSLSYFNNNYKAPAPQNTTNIQQNSLQQQNEIHHNDEFEHVDEKVSIISAHDEQQH